MPNVGPLEIAIILIIALIVLGPKKLPEMGRSVGRGLREFKRAVSMDSDEDESEPERERQRKQRSEDRQVGTGA
jgi:sec-independent protein translocase protein TatA